METKKINVGSGPTRRNGWINVDIQPFESVDVVSDVTKEWQFDGVDRIYAEHFIEHLNLDYGIHFLVNAGKSMKDGGWIRLSTPNIEWVLKTHYNLDRNSQNDNNLLDSVMSTNRAFYGWSHRFLYSPFMLKKILIDIGYKNVRFKKFGESEVEEFKNIEEHDRPSSFDDSDNIIVVEAQKDGAINFPTELHQILTEKFIKYAKSKG